MSSVRKPVALGFSGLLLACAVQADVTALNDSPYKVILDRNAFNLKDPPTPPPVTPTNPPVPPANIKLTGVSTNREGKKAWLMIPAAPPKTPNPQYLSLAEGEKQGEIEVLEINEREATVKIRNAGVPAELNFKDNGLATPAAPPVLPGAPGANPGIRTATATPYVVPPPAPVNTVASHQAEAANAALRTIPARNIRTAPIEAVAQPVVQGQPVAQPQGDGDAAVQYIKMKAQEEQSRRDGKPYPPVPPLPGANQ